MKAGQSSIDGRAARALVRASLLACLLAIAMPVFALGLGRIVVKSAPGQPLLAEIPVVAADPSELGDLQVRLASPETFRRVGLPAPDAATANLRFTVAVDGSGQPVIRVTSAAPIRQPLLTFLIEVDWGAGRLVREYSALMEAPSSLAAPAQPIQAPVVAAPNTIERAPEPPPAPVATTPVPPVPQPSVAPPAPPAAAEPAAPADTAPEPAAAGDDADVVAEPLPEPAPATAAPAPASETTAPPPMPAPPPAPSTPERSLPAPTPAPSSSSPMSASNAYTVRAGDTLSGIATGLDRGARSLDQMMLALLQANPEAFIDGNINRIRAGAVLRAPSDEALARYSSGEAAALVRQQVAQWRQAAAARMPAAAAAAAVDGAAPVLASAPRAGPGGQGAEGPRLQIVPAASGKDAGTQSGTQAGGEGTMLRQQIQESRETIAARDAEVGELKARVAELEKIQQQQQQLIAMKDTALAEARANLAKAQQATAVQPAMPAQPAAQDRALWPWLALALVLAAAGGWWWWKRRGGDAAASPFATPRIPRVPRGREPQASRQEPAPAPAVPSFAAGSAGPATAAVPPAPAPVATAPTPTPAPAPTQAEARASDWTAAPATVGTMPPASPEPSRAEENASPARQVELARAYLDLGDESAARDLLREAMAGRDPVAREIAARMLRELG